MFKGLDDLEFIFGKITEHSNVREMVEIANNFSEATKYFDKKVSMDKVYKEVDDLFTNLAPTINILNNAFNRFFAGMLADAEEDIKRSEMLRKTLYLPIGMFLLRNKGNEDKLHKNIIEYVKKDKELCFLIKRAPIIYFSNNIPSNLDVNQMMLMLMRDVMYPITSPSDAASFKILCATVKQLLG